MQRDHNLYIMYIYFSDQTPKQIMSVEQLKNEIHKQTIIIKELTVKQAILDKINEVCV